MRYWWLLGMIACFGLWGQSPESISIHLFLDEFHQQTLWQIEIIGHSDAKRSLGLAPNAVLLESRAMQDNLPIQGLKVKTSSNGLEFPSHPLASRWILKLQWPYEGLSDQLQNGGLSWDGPASWPLQWPVEWVCPLAFSLQLTDSTYDFQFSLEADLVVTESHGPVSWFFPPTVPMSPNDLQLWVGKKKAAVAVADHEPPHPTEVIEPHSEKPTTLPTNELATFLESESPTDSALFRNYVNRLELLWSEQNANACALATDSLFLLGKLRDAELMDLEDKLMQAPVNPLHFLKSLEHWRFSALRHWKQAFEKPFTADAEDRSLRHTLLRRAVYSLKYPVFDPTGDTSAIAVRLRHWVLAQYNDSLHENIWCQLLQDQSFPEDPAIPAADLWQKVVEEEVLPVVHLAFRHDRSLGKVYVYAQQIQEEAVAIHSQLAIRSEDTTAYFPLVLHKPSDTLLIDWKPSISYLKADPTYEQPVWWQEELSDLQRLMWFREAQLKADRLEAMDQLLQSSNANLKRTAVGIGLMDDWAEIRIMAVLGCAELPAADWNRLKGDLEKMQVEDPDARVRSYAADALLERSSGS